MAKKNQLTKSDYLPMEEYKKLLRLLHKDRQYLWELYVYYLLFVITLISNVYLKVKKVKLNGYQEISN